MGYSETKKAIRRVEIYLKQMAENESRLEFESENPKQLAGFIFEGIHSSKKQEGEPYSIWAKLGAKYKIRVFPSKIVCEPRDASILTKSRTLASVTIPNVSDPLGIIGAAIEHKAPIMEFPNANGAILPVYNWAIKNNYYVVRQAQGLTLTKDESVKELAWKP